MPDAAPLRVLIVGASGVFGSRLAERLALERGIALTLAGRTREPLDALARTIGTGAVRTLDRNGVGPRDLAGYDLVIDAAGPFQDSADALVRACIEAGVDYLDLADGRQWVTGFADRYDDRARAAGVSLITGASSIPALSHAVIDRLTNGWRQIDTIRIGIFPGNRAPRGMAVVEAILSYVGRPVPVWMDGRWQNRRGWGDLHRVDAGSAGQRWASICDTPEQDLLVERYRPTRDALFFAGMELSILHLGLWLLSLPVRAGLLRSLRPFSRPLFAAAQWLLPFGSDKGAMTVSVTGTDADGAATQHDWLLEADANRGPYVPILAAIAMVRRRHRQGREQVGASVCSGLLSLHDFDANFAALGVRTSLVR